MKYISTKLFILAAIFFFAFPSTKITAQNSIYDNNGKIKSVEQRKLEESQRNQNNYTPTSTSASNTSRNHRETGPTAQEINQQRYTENVAADKLAKQNAILLEREEAAKVEANILRYDLKNLSEGLTVARQHGGYGFVDKKGTIIIPIGYIEATEFHDGWARIKQYSGEWGFIDKTNKLVLPCIYSEVSDFYEDRAYYSFLKHKSDGIDILTDENGDFGSRWGIMDRTGKVIIEYTKWIKFKNFSEGLAAIQYLGSWGFINKDGIYEIERKYQEANSFSNGLAKVKLDYGWGYINKNGEEVISTEFESIGNFENNKVLAVLKGENYYFDNKGQQVGGNKQFIRTKPFGPNPGPYFDQKVGWKTGSDYGMVKIGSKFGYVNLKKKEPIALIYDYSNGFSNGMGGVSQGDKWGFLNSEGGIAIPLIYSAVSFFEDGITKVAALDGSGTKNLWGVIDKTGAIIIPLIYDYVFLYDGKIKTGYNNDLKKAFYFDKTGKKTKK